ncbi:MAG: cysteine synthase family protein [Dehalococcoidia bacterium]|nr:cysteine synthase family protein [Dehalococcoidia bacterium]
MPPLNLLSLVGNTPLVELPRISPKPGIRIFAKLEGQNPTGSVKDRVALALVEQAERRGKLKAGDTIVEASSGNTGLALAFVAKQKGYKAVVALPRHVAPSIRDLLHMYGVEIVWCDGGMDNAIRTARALAQERGYFPLGQFSDEANVEVHYRTTGKEILDALPQVDAFVAGIGTSGTAMGVGRRLREANPEVQIIGIEPRPGEYLQGLRPIGEGFMPPLLRLGQLSGRFMVDSATAFECARLVAREEGILAGASGGAALHGALRVAQRMERGNIVAMFADGGWKYLPSRPWAGLESPETQAALDDVHWW